MLILELSAFGFGLFINFMLSIGIVDLLRVIFGLWPKKPDYALSLIWYPFLLDIQKWMHRNALRELLAPCNETQFI